MTALAILAALFLLSVFLGRFCGCQDQVGKPAPARGVNLEHAQF